MVLEGQAADVFLNSVGGNDLGKGRHWSGPCKAISFLPVPSPIMVLPLRTFLAFSTHLHGFTYEQNSQTKPYLCTF